MYKKHLTILTVWLSVMGAIYAQDGNFTISPLDLEPVQTTVGDSAIAAQFIVRRYFLNAPVYLHWESTDNLMFALDKDSADGYVDVIHAWYVPTEAGKHKACLLVDCPDVPAHCDTVRFEGTATAPSGIDAVPVAPSASRQIMQNGVVYILHPQGTYTITGAPTPR